MGTSALELALHPPHVGTGACMCEGLGYARILLQRYLNRAGATMNDESPLIRQWLADSVLLFDCPSILAAPVNQPPPEPCGSCNGDGGGRPRTRQ